MDFSKCTNLFYVSIILCFLFLYVDTAVDTITPSQFIKDPETITSKGGNFTLGFFSPQNSTYRYVGIWWQPKFTVIWVANKNQPLNNSYGVVTISEDGNLVVLNAQKHVIWSTYVFNNGSNSTCKLLDSGNLVLQESTTGSNIWESFQHPSNVWLPYLKLRSNKVTGEKVKLTSWKSPSDPSNGSFSISIERLSMPEVFVWNETRPFWRTGPWNSRTFTGLPYMKSYYLNGMHVGDDGQGNVEMFFTNEEMTVGILNSEGNLEKRIWIEKKKEWVVAGNTIRSKCDVYGLCGPFTVCNLQRSPTCSCLKGFEPTNKGEWNRQNRTNGCFRITRLQCERVNNQNTSADKKTDGFFKLQMVKVPDFADGSSLTLKPDTCRSRCLENCTCMAYSYDAEIGCMSWTQNLIDIQQFSDGGLDLYIRLAYTELDKQGNRTVIITITVTIGITLIFICAYIMSRKIANQHVRKIVKGFLQFTGRGAPLECTSDNGDIWACLQFLLYL